MTNTIQSPSQPVFPFSAVAGQTIFKLALILSAINPRIGGVLVSGPRGSAKSTLARAMADLIPIEASSATAPFVTLPLGAAEESVIGAVNLERMLQEQQVVFQEGLLAKANNGILYVDEVNLLPDHLVDVLLDVSASGVNVVEREGVSHSHDARFILLGTMNPDEGELRPQLQDRFGLAVNLTQPYSISERIDIVQRREAFDHNPFAFIERFAHEQSALRSRIAAAKKQLAQVSCSDQWREHIATACVHANVDGVRADIVWCRAAMAHAAWEQRDAVIEKDILAVEELVLAHRRQPSSSSPPAPPSSSNNKSAYSRPPEKNAEKNTEKNASNLSSNHSTKCAASDVENNIETSEQKRTSNKIGDQESNASSALGDWGSMDEQVQPAPVLLDDTVAKKIQAIYALLKKNMPASTQAASQYVGVQKGRATGYRQLAKKQQRQAAKKIHWFSTLVANVGAWPLRCVRYRPCRTGQSVLHIFLLDTSASTLQNNWFLRAKIALLTIAKTIYLNREQLVVMGFGNQTVDVLLPQRRAPKILQRWFDNIAVGGGTPFRDAITQAYTLQKKQHARFPEQKIITYIVTDGRISQSVDDLHLLGNVVVIDIEASAVKRGKAEKIADALQGFYLPCNA